MKRFICIILLFAMCFTIPAVSYAMGDDAKFFISTSNIEDNSRAEETCWYYRTYDGMFQKRLWSITYGYWLTDWITIGYV